MRAVEVTGTIDRQGNLLLDRPFEVDRSSRVRVIMLCSEPSEPEAADPDEFENLIIKKIPQHILDRCEWDISVTTIPRRTEFGCTAHPTFASGTRYMNFPSLLRSSNCYD